MTQPGETDDFSVSDHLNELKKYGGREIVNCVIANSGKIPEELEKKYEKVLEHRAEVQVAFEEEKRITNLRI